MESNEVGADEKVVELILNNYAEQWYIYLIKLINKKLSPDRIASKLSNKIALDVRDFLKTPIRVDEMRYHQDIALLLSKVKQGFLDRCLDRIIKNVNTDDIPTIMTDNIIARPVVVNDKVKIQLFILHYKFRSNESGFGSFTYTILSNSMAKHMLGDKFNPILKKIDKIEYLTAVKEALYLKLKYNGFEELRK